MPGIQTPYLDDGFTWLRGNLHAHTTLSDGRLSPGEVLAAYEREGYDFLAISDHDRLVPPDDYRDATRLLLLPAVEVTARGPHMLAIGVQSIVEPDADRQRCIEQAAGMGGITILNHPNWGVGYNHFPQERMEALRGYAGIEIYNAVIEWLEGSALALDRWDRLLSSGRRVWGFANDDMHWPENVGRGWNVAQCRERTPAAVLEALREGRFYASTGVTIDSVRLASGVLAVEAPDAQRIRFVGRWGRELAFVDGPRAAYPIGGGEGGYVRAECYGAGGRTAWTQPVWVPE